MTFFSRQINGVCWSDPNCRSQCGRIVGNASFIQFCRPDPVAAPVDCAPILDVARWPDFDARGTRQGLPMHRNGRESTPRMESDAQPCVEYHRIPQDSVGVRPRHLQGLDRSISRTNSSPSPGPLSPYQAAASSNSLFAARRKTTRSVIEPGASGLPP